MIVTITLNPALHVHYDADLVELGAENRVGRVRYRAGGRGLAVARLLHTFGHEVVAAGLAGGSAGELIRTELARVGVPTQFTRITGESRRVVLVEDASTGRETSFAEPAPYITTEELGRLAADYRALLDAATAVVLCGSLPAGLPAEIYASLTSYAAGAGVPVILNAGGDALRQAISRGPALVVPELAAGNRPAGGAGISLAGLEASGPCTVVLPAGRGVRVLTPGGEWRAELHPAGDTAAGRAARGSTASYGSQDALVAGLVPGIALGWSWPDRLRHALALAAAASQDGEADLVAYERLLPAVIVTGPAG